MKRITNWRVYGINILFLECLTDLTKYQNSVVLMDNIDGINTQKDYITGTNTLVSSICQLLDYLQREGGVLVATCTQREEVDTNLKRPGRFVYIHTHIYILTFQCSVIRSAFLNTLR